MSSPAYTLSEAVPSDSEAISSLFALSWTSPFTLLQFGNVDPASFAASMAPRIADRIKNSSSKFIVARHPETQEIASVAQWSIPLDSEDDEGAKETPEEKEERQQFEDEAYRKKLPQNSNRDLIMEFTVGVRHLRDQTLQGRKHYMLENLATHPEYRCQGLASRLIEWVFPQADARGLAVYLDTASDNKAMRLYKKLGFQQKGSRTIEDLSKYGGEGSETHVALVRYPKGSTTDS